MTTVMRPTPTSCASLNIINLEREREREREREKERERERERKKEREMLCFWVVSSTQREILRFNCSFLQHIILPQTI